MIISCKHTKKCDSIFTWLFRATFFVSLPMQHIQTYSKQNDPFHNTYIILKPFRNYIALLRIGTYVSVISKLHLTSLSDNILYKTNRQLTLNKYIYYLEYALYKLIQSNTTTVWSCSTMHQDHHDLVQLSIEAFDTALVELSLSTIQNPKTRLTTINSLKYHLKHYNLPKTSIILEQLLEHEANFRLQDKKAKVIQKHFREAIANPYKELCRRRLYHELHALS